MKIRSILMIGALCATLAGCTKASIETPAPEPQYKVLLSGDLDTRTSLAPELEGYRPVLWKTGDMLGLFVKQGTTALSGAQNVIARLEKGTDAGAGFSRGTFATTLSLEKSTTYSLDVYYPYISDAGTADAIVHSIPSVQTQPAASDSRHLGLSGHFSHAVAEFTTPADLTSYTPVVTFTLSHKTSTILLSLTAGSSELAGWKVKSASVKTPGSYIAGDVKYVPSTGAFELTGNKSETLALNVPGGAVLSTDAPTELYLVAYPTPISGKDIEITYTLEAPDASAVKTLTHTRAMKTESNALAASSIHVINETIPASNAEGWVYSADDAAYDLSANGTANCYIVSTPGKYSFDATVIGNGQKGILLPVSTTHFHTETAEIAPTQAALVWQTVPGLITLVSFADGRVTFTKSADVEYGNALIAAKDASGTILWSWHIWCTETGANHTYVSSYGTYETMDRNIGATYASSELVRDDALVLRTVGMYYQWGRKDPIVGPADMSTKVVDGVLTRNSSAMATLYNISGGEYNRPSKKTGSNITGKSIESTIKEPAMQVMTGATTASDWFAITGKQKVTGPEGRGYSFWGNPQGYNYSTASKPVPVKTIYDPCPVGYMVPPNDWFLNVRPLESIEMAGGTYLTDGGTTVTWIPFASKLHNNTSAYNWLADQEGNLWYSSYPNSNASSSTSLRLSHVDKSTALSKVTGTAIQVRCVQELR